jgi:hypothetical protein
LRLGIKFKLSEDVGLQILLPVKKAAALMVGIFNTKSRYLLDVKKNANLYLKEL